MATITQNDNPELIRAVGYARQIAEQILGLRYCLTSRLPALLALGVTSSSDVIDDGAQGQLPFTKDMFCAYIELNQMLDAAIENQQVLAALNALRVRDLDVIVAGFASEIETDPALSPEANALRRHIRPFARQIRRVRSIIRDRQRIIPKLIAALQPTDLIDEGRAAEGIAPLPVGHLQVLFALLAAVTSETVNDERRATAIDAACCEPLEVR